MSLRLARSVSLGPAACVVAGPVHSSVRARAHFPAPLGGGRRRRPGTRRVAPALGSGLSGSCVRTPSGRRVCESRSVSSARSAALRGGWRRRRRPGIRLAAAPRVRAALSCSAAACLIARVLSDRVPRPCSIAELRPLEVPPEIPSLRRSDYAMVTACAFTARRAIGKIELGAGRVSGPFLSTRRARRTAPSNQKDSWPLLDFASVLEDAS